VLLGMNKSEFYIIISGVLLFTFFFVIIPYWKYQNEGNNSVESSELIEIQSKIQTVRKTSTGGRYSEPIIYLELKDYTPIFRLANSSYRAIDIDEVLNQLNQGVTVSILTRQSEIDRSTSQSLIDNILNGLLKWRKQPLIYGLATENLTLLTIAQYNEQQKDFNGDNIKWGIIFVLFVLGRLLWAVYIKNEQKTLQ
jgi:hypothetical protein